MNMMDNLIYLNKEYIKYRENLGENPRKPLKFDSEWSKWVEYKNKNWPKGDYIVISHNVLKYKK